MRIKHIAIIIILGSFSNLVTMFSQSTPATASSASIPLVTLPQKPPPPLKRHNAMVMRKTAKISPPGEE